MSATILLVDDSTATLLMEKMLFMKYTTFSIVTAADGAEAVQKALTERPNLILMDVEMPKMDGFEACRAMRKTDALREVPIILVTSRGEPCNMRTGFDSGCNDFLTKPVNNRDLLDMVNRYLAPQEVS